MKRDRATRKGGKSSSGAAVADHAVPPRGFSRNTEKRPDTQEKWPPVLMEEDAVCARYDATPADLVAWRQFKFPAPRTKHLMARFSWTTKAVRSYVTDDLDEWDAQIRDLAAHLPRP